VTAAPATDAGQDTPGRRPSRSRHPRQLALVALAAVLALLAADAALVAFRIDRLDLHLSPATDDGDTWVLIGLDSRAELPTGATPAEYGTAEDVPGSRADVILVVHRDHGRTSAFSVPRDLVVGPHVHPTRLAVTWADGPRATVDALCTIGVPTDHLVTVDLAGFAATVDAAGGVEVDVAAPIRDPAAGLELTSAGRQRLDGRTALALVRSRHPEHLVDGHWVPTAADPDGRASVAGTVVTALAGAVRSAAVRPWRLQAVAWAGSGAVTVDPGTTVADLVGLAGTELPGVEVLPAGMEGTSGLLRPPTEETTAALADAGLTCHP
jgi:LCP family protein required for cell wall assembly